MSNEIFHDDDSTVGSGGAMLSDLPSFDGTTGASGGGTGGISPHGPAGRPPQRPRRSARTTGVPETGEGASGPNPLTR